MALRVKVCTLADVPDNEMRAFQVKGVTWPVIVTRVDGELFACPGVCPHEDVALWNGELTGTVITCPGHAYDFDLRTGTCKHDRELELRRYKITLVGNEVWVDLL